MSVVWSCNEWDQLEEVIVGNPLRARFPTADPSTQLTEYPDRPLEKIPQGPFPQWIIDETEEDLNGFVTVLEDAGVTVKRPETWPHEAKFSTINWESEGYYNYCPRDIMLVIGDHIIETPNVMRSRAQESFSYRNMMVEYFRSGAKWYSAPKPMLLDSLFDVDMVMKWAGSGCRRFSVMNFGFTFLKMSIMAVILTRPLWPYDLAWCCVTLVELMQTPCPGYSNSGKSFIVHPWKTQIVLMPIIYPKALAASGLT